MESILHSRPGGVRQLWLPSEFLSSFCRGETQGARRCTWRWLRSLTDRGVEPISRERENPAMLAGQVQLAAANPRVYSEQARR